MALIQSTAIPSSGGYEIDQSLRFNNTDDAYLSFTPSSSGNRKTWTWSGWLKRGKLSGYYNVFGTPSEGEVIRLEAGDTLAFYANGGAGCAINTTQVLRDSSSWYHIIVVFDTTQSTASNRVKFYINGSQITSFGSTTYPALNSEFKVNQSGQTHYLGNGHAQTAGRELDGYLAETHLIDGQALTPADFGETGTYGEWKPIEYSGSYGTNGFYLNFAGAGIMTATGGNSTATDGSYKAASFTADGTFTPSADGFVEYLVVGGGGNGAGFGASSVSGGGGGAGGYRTGYLAVTGGTGYSITVGGAAQNSVFSSITSIAGGNGGANQATTGGSGGGSGAANTSGAAGTSGQGNAGGTGDGNWGYTTTRSGGGGGSGGAGGNADSSNGGAAGAGTANDITGSSVTYAAGGEGVAHTRNTAGTPGAANTGNGGGGTGGSGGNSGGAGGSGIVIIRYKFQ